MEKETDGGGAGIGTGVERSKRKHPKGVERKIESFFWGV